MTRRMRYCELRSVTRKVFENLKFCRMGSDVQGRSRPASRLFSIDLRSLAGKQKSHGSARRGAARFSPSLEEKWRN